MKKQKKAKIIDMEIGKKEKFMRTLYKVKNDMTNPKVIGGVVASAAVTVTSVLVYMNNAK